MHNSEEIFLYKWYLQHVLSFIKFVYFFLSHSDHEVLFLR